MVKLEIFGGENNELSKVFILSFSSVTIDERWLMSLC